MTNNRELFPSEEEQKLRSVLSGIKTRCKNIKEPSFVNYGARGITLCDEWDNSTRAFVDWGLANGYQQGLDIDRINNDGNYEPDNCRFVTRAENANNRRDSIVNRLTEQEQEDIAIEYLNTSIGVEETLFKFGISYGSLKAMLKGRTKELKHKNKSKKKKVYQYSKEDIFIKEFNSVAEAVEETGIRTIQICAGNGNQQTAGGFKWTYNENI